MKRPTVASRKKVTTENLERLGAARLAEILAGVADSRPDLKRRLRMELAAGEGAEHLVAEIDKRLAAFKASRARVSWRQRNAFVRELDGLRSLIATRLVELDQSAAVERLLAFLALAPRVRARFRDREGALAEVFRQAARDLAPLARRLDPTSIAGRLGAALLQDPAPWADWLPSVLEGAPAELADAMLCDLVGRGQPGPGFTTVVRQLADATGNVDAYRASFPPAGLQASDVAAAVGARLLAADRVEEAGAVLRAGRPDQGPRSRTGGLAAAEPEDKWESAWIDYLQRSGELDAAQDARWASFERTLSVERAKAFAAELDGFADVEAEERAFRYAAAHPDFVRALGFLMEWPALREASEMIQRRGAEATVPPDLAELWAGRLRGRYPAAANILLRRAAAAAFRRREFATSERLTAEADTIEP